MKAVPIVVLAVFLALTSHAQFKRRVVAWTKADGHSGATLSVEDSTSFIYANKNGSVFNYETLDYSFGELRIPGVWGDLFVYDIHRTGEFTVEKLLVAADSILTYHFSPDSQKFQYIVTNRYRYQPNGKLSRLGQGTGTGEWIEIPVYDAGGACVKLYEIEEWNGSTDTAQLRYLFYGPSGQLERDSTFRHPPFSGRPADEIGAFTYSGSQCTKLVWKTWDVSLYRASVEYTLSYYPNGKTKGIVCWSTTVGSPTVMQLSSKDSFGYSAGCLVPTFWEAYAAPNHFAYPVERRIVKHWNSMGYPDSVISYYDNGTMIFPSTARKVYYDALNNPLRIDHYYLYNNPLFVNRREVFYYEPYLAGVDAPEPDTARFLLHPNPGKGSFRLQYGDALNGQSVWVRITDLAGRVVHSRYCLLQGTQQEIQLADAAPGMYGVSVTNARGERMFSGSYLLLP